MYNNKKLKFIQTFRAQQVRANIKTSQVNYNNVSPSFIMLKEYYYSTKVINMLLVHSQNKRL